ncbi:MAG: hypothetical protein N2254_02475 [bacterium]|nr:hypothetical protein [bacterium]
MLVEPLCFEFFRRKGLRVLRIYQRAKASSMRIYQRAKASSNGKNLEYMIVGETKILLVSSYVRAEDINDLIDNLKEFFESMLEYKGVDTQKDKDYS